MSYRVSKSLHSQQVADEIPSNLYRVGCVHMTCNYFCMSGYRVEFGEGLQLQFTYTVGLTWKHKSAVTHLKGFYGSINTET